MKAILVLTQIFLRQFIDVRVGTFFSNLCTYIYTIYLPNMATLAAFTDRFFERGDIGDNGDNGDKCRSTKVPSPPNLAPFLMDMMIPFRKTYP